MPAGKKTYNIDVQHVTRVEGHGRIKINTQEGRVEDVKLCITEANRFFENFVKGMQPQDIPWIVSRICGICCVGHQLTATKAVETAQNIQVSEQTILLRKLLTESQFIQSHVLHVYFLAVPDFMGVPSVLPLAKTHPDVVRRALQLKKLANDFTAVFGGRMLHPMSNTLKGWRKLPDMGAAEQIRDRLRAAIPDLEKTVQVAKSLKIPPYQRETEYVSLKHPNEYALYQGEIYSSDTQTSVCVDDYRQVTNEFTVAHSTTKWSRWHRDSYFVGALARFNNNYDQLLDPAKEAAEELGLSAPCYNPYMNNLAQVVEIVHCAYNSLNILEELLNKGVLEEDIAFVPQEGQGVGSCEVPRGILFHEYSFDKEGRCIEANAVIPTSQNINNIERDMRAFVPQMLPGMSEDELTLHMEMLLRAYDPCISCSVHMLQVDFSSTPHNSNSQVIKNRQSRQSFEDNPYLSEGQDLVASGGDRLSVIGLGNSTGSDDVIGLCLVERLASQEQPSLDLQFHRWESCDAATLANNLLDLNTPVLLVDCADLGIEPGESAWIDISEIDQKVKSASTHALGLFEGLLLARELGFSKPVKIFGIQPFNVVPGTEMSPGMTNRIQPLLEAIQRKVAEMVLAK